jgi:hypothetical protein
MTVRPNLTARCRRRLSATGSALSSAPRPRRWQPRGERPSERGSVLAHELDAEAMVEARRSADIFVDLMIMAPH